MQERLALPRPAIEVERPAIPPDLRDVSANGAPASNLPLVIRTAASRKVSAVPLEPSARVLAIDPALPAPNRKRLRRVHPKVIERGIVTLGTELGEAKPVLRKLRHAVGHVAATEHAELEKLLGRQLRLELGAEIPSHGFGARVDIATLHLIANNDSSGTATPNARRRHLVAPTVARSTG